MTRKLKGVLFAVLAIVFSFCLIACEATGDGGNGATDSNESAGNESTHVCVFENWTEITAATCDADGEEEGKCSCGKTSTRSIPASGHSFDNGEVILSSTCTEHGTERGICINCGQTADKELPLAKHQNVQMQIDSTCQTAGRQYEKCLDCGEETEGTEIPKKEHGLEEIISSKTLRSTKNCKGSATYWYTCGDCNEVSDEKYFSNGDKDAHKLKFAYNCADNICLDCEETVKATGEHEFGEWVEVGASACSATVVKFHACSSCGYVEDELGVNNAVTHHDMQFTETVATCEEEGAFTVTCKNCDFESVVTYGALGHVYDFKADANGHKQVCIRENCNSSINQSAHVSGGEATCEEDEICLVCNYLIEGKSGHSWKNLADKTATCEEDGYKNAKECENCKLVEKQVIKGGHDFTFISSVRATCTKDGRVAHNYCKICDKAYSLDGKELTTVIITAKGHNYANSWWCEKDGHYRRCINCLEATAKEKHESSGPATEQNAEVCTICNYEISPKIGHSHDLNFKEKVEPTCLESGYTVYACLTCEYTAKRDFVSAKGHNFGEEEIVQNLTCTTNETVVKVCGSCKTEEKRITKFASGHKPSGWIIDEEATCVKLGHAYKKCTVSACGEVLEETYLPKTAHSYQETEREDPTCEQSGYTLNECDGCDSEVRITLSILAHKASGWIIDEEATCEDDGYRYKVCLRENCGKKIAEEDIPALNHKESEWITDVYPTCEGKGSKHTVCTREGCGKTVSEEEIPSLGHDEAWRTAKEATCEENGLREKYCKRENCGKKLGEEVITAPGHDEAWRTAVAATCGKDGLKEKYCKRENCGEKLGEEVIPAPTTHLESEWITDTYPTCEEKGSKHTVCTREGCGETVSEEEISSLGHDEAWRTAVAATCGKDGLKEKYCKRENCGKKLGEEVIPAPTTHLESGWITDVYPTCEEKGSKHTVCTREGCGKTVSEEEIPVLGHDEAWRTVVAATCGKDGLKEKYCKRENCGKKLGEEVITALGHDGGEWNVETEATCLDYGEEVLLCGRCGEELDRRTVDPNGHEEGEWKILNSATCTEDGLKYVDCKVCGERLDEDVITSPGHDGGKWTTKEATCTEDGIKERNCGRCGTLLESEILPLLGHDGGEWKTEKEPTCNDAGLNVLRCGRCKEELERKEISSLGHEISDGISYDGYYHYFECQRDCGYREGEEKHNFNETVHTTEKDEGDKIIYTAYVEFSCECGYSFDSDTVTNTVHQGIEVIPMVAPTCEEEGYSVGIKCSVEGCDEIFVEPTVVPALGHNFINGLCLRCGENDGGENPILPPVQTVTIKVKIVYADGEVWDETDELERGLTVADYFRTWDMTEEEIEDIYYFAINGVELPVSELYNYAIEEEITLEVRFNTVVTEAPVGPNNRCIYILMIGDMSDNTPYVAIYFSDGELTVSEFFAKVGVFNDSVYTVIVNGETVTDYSVSLGSVAQIKVDYGRDFEAYSYATLIVEKIASNDGQTQEDVYYLSMDLGGFTLGEVAYIIGFDGQDFVQNRATVNGEKKSVDYTVREGDEVRVIDRVAEPTSTVEITYEFRFTDKTQTGSVSIHAGGTVKDVIFKLTEGAEWSAILFEDIYTATVGDKTIDKNGYTFEENSYLYVEFSSFASTVEETSVRLQFNYADGSEETNAVQFISGGTFRHLIAWICSADGWEEIFEDIDSVYVQDEQIDKYAYVIKGGETFVINFKSYVPEEEETFSVYISVFDANNNVYRQEEIQSSGAELIELLYKMSFPDEQIEAISEVIVNGNPVDFKDCYIAEYSKIEVYLSISNEAVAKDVYFTVIVDGSYNTYTVTLVEPQYFEDFYYRSIQGRFGYGEIAEFFEEGVLTINGEVYNDGGYYLTGGEKIEYRIENSCEHDYDDYGYCHLCGNWCEHPDKPEYGRCPVCGYESLLSRDFIIIVYYGSDNYEVEGDGYFNENGEWVSGGTSSDGFNKNGTEWFKVYLESTDINFFTWENVYGSLLGQYDFSLSLDYVTNSGYEIIWSYRGESISSGDVLYSVDYSYEIVGVLSKLNFNGYAVTFENAEFGNKTYRFSYPVNEYYVRYLYCADMNIDESNYNFAEKAVNTSGNLIVSDSVYVCSERQESVRYSVIDENGRGEILYYSYMASKRPDIAEFLEQIGLSLDEYSVYNSDGKELKEEYEIEWQMTVIKKSLVKEQIWVTVTYQTDRYSEVTTVKGWTYGGVYSLDGLLSHGIYDETGAWHNIPFDYHRYIFKVDGEILGDEGKEAEVEYYVIYNDCNIELVLSYNYEFYYDGVEYEDGETYSVKSEKILTGAELIELSSLKEDPKNVIILVNEQRYTYGEFIISTFEPYEGERCSITFKKGGVRLDVSYLSENGYDIYYNYEEIGDVSLEKVFDEEIFQRYTWTVFAPNGQSFALTDYGYIFTFDADNAKEEGRNYYLAVYTIIGEAKGIIVSLSVDGTWIGEKYIEKSSDLTLAKILTYFDGNYKIEDYDWNIYSKDMGIGYGVYDVIEYSVSIDAYDLRPRITINYDGTEYVIHHQKDMTLGEVFTAVYEKYGVYLSYDNYYWDNYSYDDTVIREGETNYISGRYITYVTVNFWCDYAWIDNNYGAEGDSGFRYYRDSSWTCPEIDLGGYDGLFTFTGKWLYKNVENGNQTDEAVYIESIEDLFKLNRQRVDLYAEVVENRSVIAGTYWIENSQVIIIDEKTITVWYYGALTHQNEEYEIVSYMDGYNYSIRLVNSGYSIDRSQIQDYNRITEDRVCIIVIDNYDDYTYFTSIEEYQNYIVNRRVESVCNVYGEEVTGEIENGKVYVITTTYVEEY